MKGYIIESKLIVRKTHTQTVLCSDEGTVKAMGTMRDRLSVIGNIQAQTSIAVSSRKHNKGRKFTESPQHCHGEQASDNESL